MMFHYPDPDTGYCEDEQSFVDEDREQELAELEREQLLEVEAEEIRKTLWAGPIVPYLDDSPIYPAFVPREAVDPETGCTAAEMKEQEVDLPPRRPVERGAVSSSPDELRAEEGRVA